ncbi:MAG: hypothetical protein ACRD3P_02425 [Terriglobales bacterium]
MSKPFNELRERLLRAGVGPRHVRRYLKELSDHLADLRAEEERGGRSGVEAGAAALARLGGMDDLGKAMIERREFQSWSARAPWAVFGLGPLCLLAGAWFIALLILWTGWQIFMPQASTPFIGLIDGWAVLYFGVGRLLYFGAPIFIGWVMGLVAARQRMKALWPAIGVIAISLLSALAQVHAHGPATPGGFPHVSLGFAGINTIGDISPTIFHCVVIVVLAVLPWPWLLWRRQKTSAI